MGGPTGDQTGRASFHENGDTVGQRDIKTVMEAHVDELMAIPGVTGVAIGELDDNTPCILVLTVESPAETGDGIPDMLEGYPVRLLESGEIRPMRGD